MGILKKKKTEEIVEESSTITPVEPRRDGNGAMIIH